MDKDATGGGGNGGAVGPDGVGDDCSAGAGGGNNIGWAVVSEGRRDFSISLFGNKRNTLDILSTGGINKSDAKIRPFSSANAFSTSN